MRPTLFTLRLAGHDLGLHTYGVMVALGFAVGIWLFWREGRRQGLDGGKLLDLSFWCIVAGLAGSRVAYLAVNAQQFAEACIGSGRSSDGRLAGCAAIFKFWDGGFVFYGGAVAAGLVVALFCRREGWSFARLGDLAAPTLAIGHALGRLGCFAAGCCFGKACPAPWGVSFPAGSVAHQELTSVGLVVAGAHRTVPLHPTQLYEAGGELIIFVLLLLMRRRWARTAEVAERQMTERRVPGGLILLYAGAYALLRFGVEIFRGDSARRYVFEWAAPGLARVLGVPPDEPLLLSVSQLVSLLVLAAVAVTFGARARALRLARAPSFSAPGP